ncbi:hypothetical protein B0H34DRAFT_388705 [Crassisporium funariophilum]|nr:hypothetical protein B0H34DRAFT_388705 [Crassisporium funariophilum]
MQKKGISDPELHDDAETQWKESLEVVRKQMVVYREATAKGDKRGAEAAAEDVSSAMENVANAHEDPKVKREWKENARKFRERPDERESILEEIGRGLLILLTTPFALAGAIIYSTGVMLGGVASILKGLGSLGKYAFEASQKRRPQP